MNLFNLFVSYIKGFYKNTATDVLLLYLCLRYYYNLYFCNDNLRM